MPDSPITSRPATPESETPETDKFENNQAGQHDSFREPYYLSLKFARSLERRLSLAQTEIKRYMRVEDDLKLQIKRLGKDLACAQENFHGTNQAYVKIDAELREANKAVMQWYAAASPYATSEALREAIALLRGRA